MDSLFLWARDRARTGDNHVGNVELYQLSYSRISMSAMSYIAKSGQNIIRHQGAANSFWTLTVIP